MRIPGPAGEFQARRATWHREEREEEQEQEERRRDDVRDGENIQNEKKRRREEEGERDHPRVSNATTTKRSLWQKLFEYSSSPSPNDDAKKHGDDSSLALFKQKQFQNIQWLKNGGWRSGRLSKGRFIVEKMRKVKRKSVKQRRDVKSLDVCHQEVISVEKTLRSGMLLMYDEVLC